MLKKMKHLFLVIPMLACLFTLSSFNQVNANNLCANVQKVEANTSTPITPTISLSNSLVSQTQQPVANSEYNFYLFGCFYHLEVEMDSSGETTCVIFGRTCGNTVMITASGDGCLDD